MNYISAAGQHLPRARACVPDNDRGKQSPSYARRSPYPKKMDELLRDSRKRLPQGIKKTCFQVGESLTCRVTPLIRGSKTDTEGRVNSGQPLDIAHITVSER